MSKKSKQTVRAPVQPWQTPKYDVINDSDNDFNESHVRIYESLYRSEAWKSLSHKARDLYILILTRYKGNYTGNEVTCPFSVCEDYGFRRGTLRKLFDELDSAGFISIRRFDDCLHKVPNRYVLINWWYKKHSSNNTDKT